MKEFYNGKKVFITGHTGFKGSWLAFLLVGWGAQVKGYALPPSSGSLFSMLDLSLDIDHVEGDIRDYGKLSEALSDFQPDIVIHLAAQALVRHAYDDPFYTYETNVMGSLNLLRAVDSTPSVKSLVYITSDKCYENLEWVWGYREHDQLGGHDPYSASKACAEIVFSSFVRSYWSKRANFSASARAGNVIGGGDYSKDRIIPDCVSASLENKNVYLRNPNATRPWQHVLEPLSAYLKLAKSLFLGQIEEQPSSWNFGPNIEKEITTGELANMVLETLGSGTVSVDISEHPHEAGLLQLNCDKANLKLDWQPRWSGTEAIQMTANWYKSVNQGDCPKKVTDRNIEEYFNE
ncbi:CDP-glucose 4,6-dehydratase [marine gamma proteobacterium HTCC2207]|uniref:CDP-glucose 4,6-dehydratase n=1 Tax=gamma proteobacterium HTCC2207 TaxID=314287 RepID=Q1YPS4_9GAMM|nr:CDP-glucose 4,6-dehydratase [marine gamma proteobacterium HTCC2207] [gamma proteobacterium HTCC2207]